MPRCQRKWENTGTACEGNKHFREFGANFHQVWYVIGMFYPITLPEIYRFAPENWWLEDVFPIEIVPFQVLR